VIKILGSLNRIIVPQPDIGGCRHCEAKLACGIEWSIFVAQVVNVLRATEAVGEAKSR
jgi:hypothetical protein